MLDDPRRITIRATGAPVSFTTDAFRGDRSFASYEAGVTGDVGAGLAFSARVEGTMLREGMNNFSGAVGVKLGF